MGLVPPPPHGLQSLGSPNAPGGHLAEAFPPAKPPASTFPGPRGGGQRGAWGVIPRGERRQEEAGCQWAACLPSAQDTTAGKSATFLETFFKADQRCWEATAKQQQLLVPGPPLPASAPCHCLWGPPRCLRGPWQSRVLPWQPLGTAVAEPS